MDDIYFWIGAIVFWGLGIPLFCLLLLTIFEGILDSIFKKMKCTTAFLCFLVERGWVKKDEQ